MYWYVQENSGYDTGLEIETQGRSEHPCVCMLYLKKGTCLKGYVCFDHLNGSTNDMVPLNSCL